MKHGAVSSQGLWHVTDSCESELSVLAWAVYVALSVSNLLPFAQWPLGTRAWVFRGARWHADLGVGRGSVTDPHVLENDSFCISETHLVDTTRRGRRSGSKGPLAEARARQTSRSPCWARLMIPTPRNHALSPDGSSRLLFSRGD